jgi:hypothetical protein
VAADRDRAGSLERAAREAELLSCGLEVALLVDADFERHADYWARALGGLDVRHLLVLPVTPTVTAPSAVELARSELLPFLPDKVVLAAGTNAYFCELNRADGGGTGADALAYSLNPQIHASDDLSLVETPAAVGETVRAARSFARTVLVTPVTLRPRFNPDAPDAPPPAPDPRQASGITAAWTLGVIAALAREGAASATFFETKGPRGILVDGRPTPVLDVFRAISAPGAAAVSVSSTRPLRVAGLGVRAPGRLNVVVGSLTSEPQAVRLEGLSAPLELPPYGVTCVPLGSVHA